jgi:PleD family two-component response regulator
VLLVDGDRDLARFVAQDLEQEGFAVEVFADGESALLRAAEEPPALVLLDVELPGIDGVEVVRRLRAGPATSSVPAILLTSRGLSADKVVGLTAGADDYVVKPFDSLELVARVRTTLRRNADVRAASPLTGLPGNHRIDLEIVARAASGQPYAVCHVDLDEFKSFNDAYGFLRGDDLLLLLSACLRRAAAAVPGAQPFVGHVGGDDFVVVCAPDQAEPLCAAALADFDSQVPGFYDAVDAERGTLVVTDRRGELREHPLVSVSIGIASSAADDDRDHRAVVSAATEMKSVAKKSPGSIVAVDRRG